MYCGLQRASNTAFSVGRLGQSIPTSGSACQLYEYPCLKRTIAALGVLRNWWLNARDGGNRAQEHPRYFVGCETSRAMSWYRVQRSIAGSLPRHEKKAEGYWGYLTASCGQCDHAAGLDATSAAFLDIRQRESENGLAKSFKRLRGRGELQQLEGSVSPEQPPRQTGCGSAWSSTDCRVPWISLKSAIIEGLLLALGEAGHHGSP